MKSEKIDNPVTIPMEDLDPSFRELITQTFGGERIMSCFQCGTCVGSCPVASVNSDYSPRQIVMDGLLGQKSRLLSSPESPIWQCASCFACEENCPQGVQITDIIIALRNIAVNVTGYVPKELIDQGFSLIENGTISPLTRSLSKRRMRLGLSEKPVSFPGMGNSVEELQKIIKKTKFNEKLTEVRGNSR